MARTKTVNTIPCFYIWQPCIPGKGEDSIVIHEDEKESLYGVFDGCGGIGARVYPEYSGHTGAYLASRTVSRVTEQWFSNTIAGHEQADIKALKSRINIELMTLIRGEVQDNMLKGSLTEYEFPCTSAFFIVGYNGGQSYARVMWSGDSRVYMMDGGGLHQLSTDDVDAADPMDMILNGSVMNNVISATVPYVIHEYDMTLEDKCLLFACTDGCYERFLSPMHFEAYLLNGIVNQAISMQDWQNTLSHELSDDASDDVTLVGTGAGFRTFSQMQKYFSARFSFVQKHYIDPFDAMSKEGRLNLWNEYRETYMEQR